MKASFLRVTKGDIDGILGLLVDSLSVFLVMITLNLYVVGMPASIVFGRMLPGAAIGLVGGNIYYMYMASKLMEKEQRTDVTALPSGISIVFVITYTLGILLPVTRITGDPEMAWRIGLAANIIGALICVAGAMIGPALRKFLPRVSMLAPLAGLAIVFISGAGLKDVFSNPIVGFASMGIIIWGYIAKGRLPFRIPAGFLALLVGVVLSVFMGQAAIDMDVVSGSMPQLWIFKVGLQAFKECLPYLSIIIPVGMINFITTLNDVESAATVGDNYNIREAMLIDAAASALGAVFGCCYPNCVFIGHPGYKRMGAKTSYSLISSILLLLFALFGLFGLMNSVIPLAAVTPILVFIGVVNIEVSFTSIPRPHIPAVAIAILPFIGEFAKEQIDAGAGAAGLQTPFGADVLAAFTSQGINYEGFSALAYGTIILSMLMAALVVFVIERRMLKAAIVAAVGAACSFVGLMHSPELAINPNPQLSIAWFMIAAASFISSFYIKPKDIDAL